MYRATMVLSQTLAIVALAAVGLAQAPAAANRAAAEKQVLAAERAVNEAIAKGDMSASPCSSKTFFRGSAANNWR